VTYANADERNGLISGLRDLADFLEGMPEVPVPRFADVLVFPPVSTDKEMKEEVDRIAALIDTRVSDQIGDDGHYTASRKFGPVQYEAVGIPASWRARRAAQMSYAENVVVPDEADEEV
jgi:hypothetical protein